jgi:hypothetical protein
MKGGNKMSSTGDKMGQVYFVGAGPGAVDLITVRGKNLLEKADCVIYAGSLVNPEILSYVPSVCRIYNSAIMTLEEVLAVMCREYKKGSRVIRLHTGDPSVYGAIREQMDALRQAGIPFSIVPGVSSFCAAAAAAQLEYTLPGVSQSVIITRMQGRTPVPDKQQIQDYVEHGATLVIFLSSHMLRELQSVLLKSGMAADMPAMIVYKASWPEEKVLSCTVQTLADTGEKEEIHHTALIVIGRVLLDGYERSLLYHPNFSHHFRKGKKGEKDYD